MLRLYGEPELPAVERVCLFLEQKSLSFVMPSSKPPTSVTRHLGAEEFIDDGPVLTGVDNTAIAGVTPICRYVEKLYPSPPLLGSTALEQAMVEMWQRYVENNVLSPLGVYFFHGPCAENCLEQQTVSNDAWAEQNRLAVLDAYRRIEERVASNAYLAGESFSIADITLFSSLRFGSLIGIEVPESSLNLRRWQQTLDNRFSQSSIALHEPLPAVASLH